MLTEVIGQDEGIRFLYQVGRGSFTSPLLIVGDEGVGRKYAVMQLVKELFCVADKAIGCRCFACRQLDEGSHSDLIVVSPPDEKEIGVDQIRSVVDESDSYPATAPVRAFLIDGVDRMTPAAANALLKTLEEPPHTSRFFLLAEDANRVIPTIRSRCGRVRFKRLPESFVVSKVQQFESDDTKALVYSRMSEGSVGRAIRFWGSGKLGLRDRILTLLQAGVEGDLPSIFSIISALDKDLPLGLRFLDQLLHDLLMLNHEPARMIHIDVTDTLRAVRARLSDSVWSKLNKGLKTLNVRNSSSRINLSFHVQTLFVDAFFGV